MTARENERRLNEHEKAIEKLAAIVVGNGERGMDEIVRTSEERLEKIEERLSRVEMWESDIKEIKRMLQDQSGNAGVKFDENSHPHRRRGDNKEKQSIVVKAWDEVKARFVSAAIIAVIIVLLSNIPEIIAQIIEQLQ